MKPKAYSYIRFSTKEQEKGDSLRRQMEGNEEIARDVLHLELDDTLDLTDRGLSGFTGDNRTKGYLGEFLKLVDENKIAVGSCLIIEKFDRLTREGMLIAVNLMTGILLKGIDLYTKIDEKRFTKDKFDITDLIISAVKLEQGNLFSANLVYMLRKAWANKRNDAIIGKRKLSRGCTMWLKPIGYRESPKKFVTTGYKPIPERVEVIKLIFEKKLLGKGPDRIAQELNQMKGIWLPVRKTGKKKEVGWYTSLVNLYLNNNRRLLGELQFYRHTKVNGKRVNIPDGDPIPNYYGKGVIDEDLFYKVQKIIRDNSKEDGRGGGRGDLVNNLFVHIAICHTCKSPMRYLNRGGEIHTRQFRCANALIGLCDKTKLHYSVVEDAVLKFCEGLDVADVMPNREKAESEKSRLLNQLQAKEGEIEIIDNTMEGNLASKRIGKSEAYLIALEKSWARLNDSKIKLEAEKKDIQTQLAELSNNSKQTAEQLNSIKELIDLMKTLRKDESKKQELINIRLSLRTQLRRLIEQIIVHAENKTLTIYFRTGQRRVLNLTTSEIIVDAYPEKIFGKK